MPGKFKYSGSYLSAPIDLLLDMHPTNGTGAYFLNKVKSDAVNCINVRRASDDLTIEIGFNGIHLDIAAIEAHCIGTQGFVTYWHDQSGNGLDVIQPNASAQPLIYDSGMVTLNGKPCLDFSGNKYLYNGIDGVGSSANNTVDGNLFVSGIAEITANSTYSTFYSKAAFAASNNRNVLYRLGAEISLFNSLNSGNSIDVRYPLNSLAALHSALIKKVSLSTNSEIYRDNILQNSNNKSGVLDPSSHVFMLGAFNGANPLSTTPINSGYLNAKFQCVGFWGLDQTTNRSAINTMINDYYGVY